MASFKDKKGREWILDIDVYLVEQVEKATQVRLDKLIANKTGGLDELFSDAVLFVRVLWVMVEEAAVKKAIPPEDFGRALGGDSLEDAGNALIRAIADFAPRQQRAVLTALLARSQEVVAKKTQAALKEIEEWDPTSSEPATTAAESSDSIPAPAG